jgi:hypothetical protein
VRASRSIFRFEILDYPIFFDFLVRSGGNSRNRVSQPKYIISTMSLEAEIRFLEFLCIADVEGRRKKEDPKLLSTAMVSAIKNLLKVGRGCYRGCWVDEVHNQT